MLCIFCDAPADSREDVWPKWLLKLVPRGPARHGQGFAEAINWKRRPGPHLPSFILCTRCNTTWLSALETRTAKLLKPLVSGTYRDPDFNEQTVLATWAMKTTITNQAARSDISCIHPEHLDNLFGSKAAHPTSNGIVVWMDWLPTVKNLYPQFASQRVDAQETRIGLIAGHKHHADGLLVTLNLPHVDFEVLMYDPTKDLVSAVKHFPKLRRIWPQSSGAISID